MNANENENHAAIPLLQLQDISHYLEENGIIAGRDPLSFQENNTSYQRQDQIELAENVEAQMQYQTKVIGQFMQENALNDLDKRKHEITKKENLLQKFKDAKVSIRLKDNKMIRDVGVRNLIHQCDTILNFVSWERNESPLMENNHVFQLNQFEKDVVEHFLKIVTIKATLDDSSSRSRSSIEDFIQNNYIIDCCYIAHYLQASEILEEIVSIIQDSIDHENCASILVLADELQLMSLRQASMKYVLERLDKIKDNSEIWDNMPKSLQNHILTLQNAAQSSIIGRGGAKNVIFSSSQEFLAIFHDTLTSHKERLREAKLRQEEIIKERKREGSDDNMLGRFSKRFIQEKDVHGGSVEDAAKKIQKQEERVRTLQFFYNEQKAIFAKDMQHSDQFRGSFTL